MKATQIPCCCHLLLAILLFLAAGGQAMAHKVNVYAWPENGQIHVEARFSGGKPALDTPLEVYSHPGGELLLTARTDQEGEFDFPLPNQLRGPGEAGLKVVLLASMGHRDEWIVTPEDLAPLLSGPAGEESTRPQLPAGALTAGNHAPPGKETPSQDPRSTDDREVQRVVEQALDKKLAPIIRYIEEDRDRVSLREVLGGLGYIVGLAGIGLALGSRRKRR